MSLRVKVKGCVMVPVWTVTLTVCRQLCVHNTAAMFALLRTVLCLSSCWCERTQIETPPVATQITLSLRSQSPAVPFSMAEETLALPSTRMSSEKGGQAGLTKLIMVYSLPIGAPLEGRPALRRICVLARGGCEQQQQGQEEGVVYCHHEILLIRVRHEHWGPDLPESVPLGVTQTEGPAPYLLGIDAELLYGEWLIGDTRLGGRGFLVNYSPHCVAKSKNALNLFYSPRATSESLRLVFK